MIVTFISECQKKSLKLTRQVLDAYAKRIGQRTWQTVITEQGLQAVRSRLSRGARKTTAVACHRIRGSRRTELLWVVGNKLRFDDAGNVPVNRTGRDLLREHDQNDWQFLPYIKGIVAIAGLFHDFGKSWDPFQKMLSSSSSRGPTKRDPIRHEWVSALLFLAMVDGKTDSQWLAELVNLKSATPAERKKQSIAIQNSAMALAVGTPCPFDRKHSGMRNWIAWLIVSHHRLPDLDPDHFAESVLRDAPQLLEQIDVQTGYEKFDAPVLDVKTHWAFKHQLPLLSTPWCKAVARWARKLDDETASFGPDRIEQLDRCFRLMLTLSRATLMLGDHQYSAINDRDTTWRSNWPPIANTYGRDRTDEKLGTTVPKGAPRQKLDEHLVRVTEAALDVTHLLPAFESQLQLAQNIRALRKPSPNRFAWQNRAVEKLRQWQLEHKLDESGFFAVNMASTGEGKTFANARIMDAASPAGLRYSLALGLRTLTLQTGDEYRDKLRIDPNELAVLIGSAAVKTLHQQRQADRHRYSNSDPNFNAPEDAGAESSNALSDGFEFAYDDLIPDDSISTKLTDTKSRQLLKSPLLVCTIDHLIPAVESTRGGKQILPLLRMLSADLVIDEVDDFDHLDMPALARLVHLAGMLGRKVMISSATIPPAVAGGLFHAYREGRSQYAAFRNRSPAVTAYWTDEFSAVVQHSEDDARFAAQHSEFVEHRLKKLAAVENITCCAQIRGMACEERPTLESKVDTESARREVWFREVTASAIELHRRHAQVDQTTGKLVSAGVVRMANVEPCIDMAKYMLGCDLPADVDLRVLSYHARQVLLIRSEQERHLDEVLDRKNGQLPWQNLTMLQHLQQSDKSNVIFIVVASPAAEVGRDHDFDWAVIEPSSMRSIIQMAGRVRRHRKSVVFDSAPNIILPEYNFKAFTTDAEFVFQNPGFEGGRKSRGGGIELSSKSLLDVLDIETIAPRLDASSRIACPDTLSPETKLVHLEHRVLRNVLTEPDYRAAFVHGWTQCGYFLTTLAQRASPFRQSSEESIYKLHSDDEQLQFRQADPDAHLSGNWDSKPVSNVHHHDLPEELSARLWLPLNYETLIEKQSLRLGRSLRGTCNFLGEIRLRDDDGALEFQWNSALGAQKKRK